MTPSMSSDVVAGSRPPLWVIFTVTASGIMVNTLVAASLPEIVAGLGAAPAQAGLIIGAATLPGIVLAPVIGVLADRFGRREVLVPCLVLFGVAGGLAALAPSLWVLVALRLMQGVGSAGLINLAVVMIGDHWSGAERTRTIGLNSAVLTVGLSVYPFVGGLLTDIGGWRLVFAIYPLSLVAALMLLRHLPRSELRRTRLSDQLRQTGPVLRQPPVIVAIVASAVTFAAIFGLLLTILPIHLEQTFQLSPTLRGAVLGLPALTHTAAALSLGRLQRYTKRLQLVVATALLAGGLGVAAAAPGLEVLVLGVLCFGAGEGLMLGNLQDIAAGSATPASRGAVMALWVSAARLGQTLGPIGAAASYPALGAEATFWVGAVLLLCFLVPLFAFGYRAPEADEPHPELFG